MKGPQKVSNKAGASVAAPAPNQSRRIASPVFLSFALALVTFVVFLPSLRNDFVNYDDPDYVTSNPNVQHGLNLPTLRWAFQTGYASNWHPLTWLSHTLDYQLFGQRAGLHHLVSVLFHILNTVLLFLLLRRITKEVWRSLFVAALFALHPLHVESVAWISERKDVLSALFFFLTIGAYCHYVEFWTQNPRQRNIGYSLALVFFALGLLSKPMVVTLPFVLLLLDYWPLERFSRGKASKSEAEGRSVAGFQVLFWEKIPFFFLSAVSSVVTFLVQKKGGAVSPLSSLSLGNRAANALVSYLRYIGKMFWPDDLAVLYPHPGHWNVIYVAGSAVILAGILILVVALRKRYPYLLVGWLWFFGTMIPVIGLVQVGIQSMADRYTYVPIIGLFIMLVWGLSDLFASRAWEVKFLVSGSAAILLACAALTVRQVAYWRDSLTLFRRTVSVTRNNYLAYNNLGFYLSGQGKVAEAMENYRAALKINPAYEDALNNMGYALAGQKKYAEAIAYYEAALRVRPNHTEVHNNLGNALADTGQIDEAMKHYLIVLGQKPDHADAHNNLGIALAMKGKLDEAMEHFQQAIRFKPNYAGAHSNLGNAYAVQHRLDEAIKEYTESLRINPDDAQAHNNLANALVEQRRLPEAVEHYQEALRLNADNPEAHYNLGLALAGQGKTTEARSHFAEALRLKPDYAEARKQLDSISLTPAQ